MPAQRYISSELTHFVGANLRTKYRTIEEQEEQQYRLLIQILLQGNLGNIYPGPGFVIAMSVKGTGTSLSSNEKYSGQMVCFCDIPVEDLDLHMQKYSRFGLSFSKAFLIGKGASPVFYVSENSIVEHRYRSPRATPNFTLKQVFDTHEKDWEQLFMDLERLKGHPQFSALFNGLHSMHLRLAEILYSRLKFFDAGKEEDHEHNFYMEREWRVWGTVPFAISDVVRVIVPRLFAKRLRQDLPDFYGQVTFANNAR